MSAGVAVVEAGLEGAEGVFTTGGGLVGAAPQMLVSTVCVLILAR